jgi:hypothetical protein
MHLSKSKTNLYYLGLTILIASACDYEWRDPSPQTAAQHSEIYVAQESKAVLPAAIVKEVAIVPPDVRPTLAPGKDVSGHDQLPEKAKKIDLLELIEGGQISATSNSGSPDVNLAFDEREDTLAKSEGVNPYRVTIEFAAPRVIKAIRVLSTYSDYGWAVQLDDGPRLVVDSMVDGEWSVVAFGTGIKAKRFYVEVLRKSRDNFVHLNEIEVYE